MRISLAPCAAALLMAGCNSETSADIRPIRTQINRTTDAATTGTTRSTTAAASRQAAADDPQLTQTLVTLTGIITFEHGAPVTSGSIELKRYNYSNGRQEYAGSTSSTISRDGNYASTFPHARFVAIELTGDFPTTKYRIGIAEPGDTPAHLKKAKDFTIPRGQKLTGRVIDEAGQPVSGASVMVLRAPTPHYFPDSDHIEETSSIATGEFSIPHTAPGLTFIVANHPEMAAGTIETILPTTSPITVKMPRHGATVTGHVRRHDNGQPVGGATVYAHEKDDWQPQPKNATTAGDGSFTISHIKPGKTQLVVDIGDPLLKAFPLPESPLTQQITLSDRETTDVTLIVYPGHTVSGKVYDSETKDPLAGAVVSTPDGKTSATSEADGTYELEHVFLPHADLLPDLSVQLIGYDVVTPNQDPVYHNTTHRISSRDPVATLDFPMVPMLTVSGTIQTPDGIPVPDASVRIITRGAAPVGVSDGNGNYQLNVQPFSNAIVNVKVRGFAPVSTDSFSVHDKNIEGIDITVHQGASVSGTVVDSTGEPIEGVSVRAGQGMYDEHEEGWRSLTQVNGSFTLTKLPETISIQAHHEDFATLRSVRVDLKPGEAKTGLKLMLDEVLTISGRVVDQDNRPLAFYKVDATGPSFIPGEAISSHDGSFVLKGVAPGTYELFATPNRPGSYTIDSESHVKAEAGDTGVVVVVKDDAEKKRARQVEFTGKVINSATREPVEDIKIIPVSGPEVTIDRTRPGTFTARVEAGRGLHFDISAAGYLPSRQEFHVPSDVTEYEHTFAIGEGGAITGKVVNATNRDPIANVTVVNWGTIDSPSERGRSTPVSSFTSDADGNFTLAPAPSGDNLVSAKAAPPFAESFKRIEVKHSEVAHMGHLEIWKTGSLAGRVLTADDKNPLPDHTVKLVSGPSRSEREHVSRSTTTDGAGNYKFEDLPGQNYVLQVQPFSSKHEVEVASGQEQQADILIGTATVSGRVTRDGRLIEGGVSARSVDDPKLVATTSVQNGNYTLAGVTPGKWSLRIYEIGSDSRQDYKEEVTIPSSRTFQKDFDLPPVESE